MNCPNCNHEMETYTPFCENCGTALTEQESPATFEPTATPAYGYTAPITEHKPSLFSRKPQILGIIASAVIIFIGILTLCGVFNSNINVYGSTSSGTTTTTTYKTYGGDAYTGMQNASADASNNAAVAAENIRLTNELLKDSIEGYNQLQKSISSSVGILIICFGLLGGGYFICGMLKKEN